LKLSITQFSQKKIYKYEAIKSVTIRSAMRNRTTKHAFLSWLAAIPVYNHKNSTRHRAYLCPQFSQ